MQIRLKKVVKAVNSPCRFFLIFITIPYLLLGNIYYNTPCNLVSIQLPASHDVNVHAFVCQCHAANKSLQFIKGVTNKSLP